MKVKKYVAKTMPEAMKKIREDLGRDAFILNSKVTNTGGILGLFRKKQVEVIAAVDNEFPSAVEPEREKDSLKEKNPPVIQPASADKPDPNEKLLEELRELKDMIGQVPALHGEQKTAVWIPDPFQPIHKRLINQGLKDSILASLGKGMTETYYLNQKNISEDEAMDFARTYLHNQFASLSFGGISRDKKYIVCVGPTGVGKTTTIAKIAAHAKMNLRKKIAFVTLDTYRIGAVEQLRTYAKLLNVPLVVSYTQEDFQRAIEDFKNYDYVFIDTAGRNYRNAEYVEELQKMITFNDQFECYLVFSLTSKESDMEAIYEQFSTMPISKFIFTKLDETNSYGAMVNLSLKYRKGIAYISYGQEVPDDLVEGSEQFVIQKIIGA